MTNGERYCNIKSQTRKRYKISERRGTVQWDGNLRITKQRKIKNSESEGEKNILEGDTKVKLQIDR